MTELILLSNLFDEIFDFECLIWILEIGEMRSLYYLCTLNLADYPSRRGLPSLLHVVGADAINIKFDS